MRKIFVLIFVLSLFVVSSVLLHKNPAKAVGLVLSTADAEKAEALTAATKNIQIAFSETGFFYDKDISVSISASHLDATIHYTIDGSEPTSEDAIYSEPLHFSAEKKTVMVLKAMAVYGDIESQPLVHTYFLGKGFNSRFDTLVFSLSTNEEHLYDYDTGILVEGALRDDYAAANPDAEIIPPDPANFNLRGREGERPVYVEVFTPDGERVIAQAAGIRVSGGWSRASDQKSFRLIARNTYEAGKGKFHYDFFPGLTVDDGYGTPLRKFDTLLLRNGANDRDFGMLRHEVATRLARQAGFNEATPSRAVSVFLNGEYYGFAWLEVSINEQFLQDVYDAPTKDFDIVGDGDQWYNTDNAALRKALSQINSYAAKDLSDDAVFAELEALVDIDNLLFYYAYEMYLGNNDWPHNNMKRWRYTGPVSEGMAPELDGRWRYILYDLDWILGLYGDDHTLDTFPTVLGEEKGSPLLIALLERRDTADRFAAILCDLMVNTLHEEAISECINALYSEAKHEIFEALKAHKYPTWVSLKSVEENHADMINFASRRDETVIYFMRQRYRYGELFEISVSGGEALLNTQTGTRGRYFAELTIPVKPVLPPFTVFDYWLVNGEKVYEPTLLLSGSDAVSGKIALELVTHTELPVLVFENAYANQTGNGCVLVNRRAETVKTKGLYLSDSPDNPLLWALPEASIKAKQTLAFVGKGSSERSDLLKIQMPFRIKSGSVLYLSDENGHILDYTIVP